jgi:hypothetical protein
MTVTQKRKVKGKPRISKKKVSVRAAARKKGFRSGLEESLSNQIASNGLAVKYELTKINYVIPESNHTYTPDFVLPNGIIIESKGRFVPEDRKKHLLIKSQHPHLDIRFVFSNSSAKLNKGSKTTYSDWCIKNGYLYADKKIPDNWFNELEYTF